MKKIIFHSLLKRRIQSLSILLVVAISVAVLLALSLVYYGVTKGIETSQQRLGADMLVIPADAQTLMDDADLLFTGAPAVIYMDRKYVAQVAKLEGVKRVTAQFFGQTLNQSCCSSVGAVRLIGYDPQSDWLIQPWTDQLIGRNLAANEIIIGSKVEGFDVPSPKILGHPVKVAAKLDPTGTDLDQSILMNMSTVQAFSRHIDGYEHFWAQYGEPESLVSAILVQVEEGKSLLVSSEISQLGNFKIIESRSVLKTLQGQMKIVFIIMLACGILLTIASILQLFARFLSMAWDRKSELGLYRALGATKQDLRKLIMGEAMALTGAGVLVGLLAGEAIYMLILELLKTQTAFPFIAPHALTVAACMIGLLLLFSLICLGAVSVPLKQVGRIDPTLAIRQDDIN